MTNEINLVSAFAIGLEKHCKEWKYDYIDKLMQDATASNFIKVFCKITCTYFFDEEEGSEDFYGAEINKKEKTVKFYKCGKDHEKILLECPVEEVVNELLKRRTEAR